MLKKLPERSFLILAILFIAVIALLRNPDLKAKYFPSYRRELFNQFKSELTSNEFSPEHYWQFRERFSPGNFLRDQENTGFFATFRVTAVKKELTPLFYYESNNLNSLDALIPISTVSALIKIKEEFPGEIISDGENFVLIKRTDADYVFAFFEPIEEMQKVFGMFDYIPKEKELLKDRLWYNVSKIQL